MSKKIVLISLSTPTFNNVRAASALPYHLIKGIRESNATEYNLEIYSFNINNIGTEDIRKIEIELGTTIHQLQCPLWKKWMLKLHLLFLRVLLKYPMLSYFRIPTSTLEKIKESAPNGIWIYGEELMGLAKTFEKLPCVITMPDCESLFYHRMLSKDFATRKLFQTLRYAYAYHQYRRMERYHYTEHAQYHFVGKEDTRFFKLLHPNGHALFIRHPLYEYRSAKEIKFHQPKIKVLIAGRNDMYMHEATNQLIESLCSIDGTKQYKLPAHYIFTFLGKGWEKDAEKMKDAGYCTNTISFAPDYIEELQKHDIQITPIVVGTGTKGKVLDAISNGLLEIGTHGALENIAVESGKSCIQYEMASECVELLAHIIRNTGKYENIAENGVHQICELHDRRKIAKEFFSLFV